jgi:hypothetical protein
MAAADILKENTAKTDDSAESSHGIHKLLSFMKCRRLYGYRYMLNLREQFGSTRLSLGTAVHAGLEAHYLGKSWQDALVRLAQKPEFSYVVEDARRVLNGYFVSFKHEKLDVVSVEREYAVWIDGLMFTRRVDLVYRKDGLLYAVDHKTASDTQRRTMQVEFDPTLMSQELIGRVAIAKEHGDRFGGVVLNLIPTGKSGRYFRMPLHFPERLISEMPKWLRIYLKAEAALRSSDVSPWDYTQNPGSCYSQYGVCGYWKLCAQGPDALGEYTTK